MAQGPAAARQRAEARLDTLELTLLLGVPFDEIAVGEQHIEPFHARIVVEPARAQWAVFDAANYSQNILTAARELQQINNEIQSLTNEAQMLVNQAALVAGISTISDPIRASVRAIWSASSRVRVL